MGQNLKRLFAQSKYNGRYDGTDAMEIIECDRAQDKIHCILAAHGEALIEALEKLVKINEGSFGGESERWEQLLAQLEAEAQP
jgi:hypothetical protein